MSKSTFTRGLQCQKSLYLHKYHPELKDEISEAQLARFQAGSDVGKKAQELFPNGVEIPYEEGNYDGQVEKTRATLKKGVKIIYEAAVSFDNVFVKADILRKSGKGWEIYEVKNASKLKDEHLDDVAIQYYVVKSSGLPVSKAFVVYINDKYVRDGEIEVKKLFIAEDVTEAVIEQQAMVKKKVRALQKMLRGDMPNVDIGRYCEEPYDCDFMGHCWKHIPEYSVFSLGGKGVNKFGLYRQGIVRIEDLNLDSLNTQQRIQVDAYLTRMEYIERDEVKKFLASIRYPICFLDFETLNPPVPVFDGTKPFQQIPFQYSVHFQKSRGGKLHHSDYLAYPGKDFRKELLLKLLMDIPQNACVMAFSGFEKQVLNGLAGWFPAYKKQINTIINNLRDLAAPFRSRNVYHYQMIGSYSLKAVLPVLVPEMSYDNLAIQNGGMAMNAYSAMCGLKNRAEMNQLRKDLLEYCATDTLAMVKILEKLRRL